MLISAGRIITPARIFAPGWVLVEGGTVADVGPGPPPRPADVELPAATVVPGYVDAHVHGGGGTSFDAGTAEAAETVLRAHLGRGTTTMVASLVTMAPDSLARAVGELGPLVDDGRLAGVHLEGPWLSPLHVGAHRPDLLDLPAPDRVERILELTGDRLRMVTLAPELAGGLDAVRRIAAAGVVVGIGHTDASYEVARAALDAGATVGTHLFNAMRGLRHREPGPVAALLEHPDARVELIADGVHLHAAVVRMAAAAKRDRTVLVTDAMAAAAAADGDYRLGPMRVEVFEGIARLVGDGDGPGAIAGSTITLAGAVRYAVQVAGLPIDDAVRAATATPAALLGLERVGALLPGWTADLVVLDEQLAVRRVMRHGAWVQPEVQPGGGGQAT